MVLKCRVILASGTLTLPSDWNATDNRIWCWGPGGNGRNTTVSNISAGGGGGGGAFDEALNVGGSAGDIWTLNVGVGGGGKIDSNATFVQLPDTSYLAFAPSGGTPTGTTGSGGVGGSALVAPYNQGGAGKNTGGAGGGGGGAGPHNSLGTIGGDGSVGFSAFPGGGGGGGGGAIGDLADPDESLATAGASVPSNVSDGGDGGDGYYGAGAGAGGISSAGTEDGTAGTSNTGGGGGGGARDADTSGGSGGAGASWDYILTLTPDTWLTQPFSFDTTASSRWAQISNGTIPGGGGGGGGGRGGVGGGSNGGNGGFPGGGGGGGGFNVTTGSTGGTGGNGLILIFYEGSDVAPPPTGTDECGFEDEDDVLPTAIAWPKCDLIPASILVQVVSPTVSPGRSFTSKEKIVQPDAGYWRFELQAIPIRDRADVFLWRQTESSLNGRTGAALVPFYEAPLSTETIVAAPDDTYGIGATTIGFEIAAGEMPVAGMHFSIGERGYRIDRVNSTAGSFSNVTIWPPLRRAVSPADDIEFNDPVCRCHLERDDGMDMSLGILRYSDPTVAFVEDV